MSESPESPGKARPEFLATLGLVPPCTVEDVKQAYLERAKSAHPDVGGDMQQFIELQQAYERALEYAEFRANRMNWLGKQVEQYVYQEQVIDFAKKLGGKVWVSPIDWLKRSFGEDFAQVVEKITRVELRGPHITDKEVAYLSLERKVFGSLTELDLSHSKVTDRGIPHLLALHSLRRLDLTGTKVTRAGLEMLGRLSELARVKISGTNFGWWDRVRLRRALPNVEIEFEG